MNQEVGKPRSRLVGRFDLRSFTLLPLLGGCGRQCRPLVALQGFPIANYGSMAVADDGCVHGVETLVAVRPIPKPLALPEARVPIVERFYSANEFLSRQVSAGSLKSLHKDHRIDEGLEADEGGRGSGHVFLKGAAVELDSRQVSTVIRRSEEHT